MNNRVTKLIMPQYLHEFKCTGSACEENCCFGSKIGVEKKTYRKYKNCKNSELRRLFRKHLLRNRADATEGNYARIQFGEDQADCPF